MAVFQKWKAALEKLLSAIDHYRDMTIALESAFHRPHEHFPTTFDLEETIANIYEQRTFIKSKTDELYNVNFPLERIRDRSRTQVTINTLPPEVLARISSLACGSSCFARPERSVLGYSIRETPQTLLVLTQVCSDWRRITIGSPWLWSHIDIYQGQNTSERIGPGVFLSSPYSSTAFPPRFPSVQDTSLWLDRARNTPLSVHISSYSPEDDVSQDRLKAIFPRLSAATSLSVGPTESVDWLISTFNLWMTLVPSGNLSSLTVLGPDNSWSDIRLGWTDQSPRAKAFQSFFAHIRSLRLHSAYFDWDGPAYHGLVHLKISGMGFLTSMTREQLVSILRACPELHVLQLEGVDVQSEPQVSYDPVPLNKLEVLDLARMMSWSLKEALSIIGPGPGELSVRVNLQDTDEGIQTLQSLFGSSNVVRLYLPDSDSDLADLARHLTSLSNLRVLLLDLSFNLQPARTEAKLNALVNALGNPNSALVRISEVCTSSIAIPG